MKNGLTSEFKQGLTPYSIVRHWTALHPLSKSKAHEVLSKAELPANGKGTNKDKSAALEMRICKL